MNLCTCVSQQDHSSHIIAFCAIECERSMQLRSGFCCLLLVYSAPFIVRLWTHHKLAVVYVSMESRNLCLWFGLCCCWWSCRKALEMLIVCNKNGTSTWIFFKWTHNKGSCPDQNINQFNETERQAKCFVWNLIIETCHVPSCDLITCLILMCRWRLFLCLLSFNKREVNSFNP